MKSRSISPALEQLLAELAQRPDSMLFGRAAAASTERLESSAPRLWTGKEPGLTAAEQELLRGYREELSGLIRQLSFGLTRSLPGVSALLDPRLDAEARARALPSDELAERRAAAARLPERDQWIPGAARLLRALEGELTRPEEALELLRQGQRLAPHPMTLQHQAFWLERLGRPDEALQAALAGWRSARDPLWRTALALILGRIHFATGRYSAASHWYGLAQRHEPSLAAALSAWHCALRAGQSSAAEAHAGAAFELAPDAARAAREFKALARAAGAELHLSRGHGPRSDRWVSAFVEVV
jgi:tetratricopeptide (TPR) repeat protein